MRRFAMAMAAGQICARRSRFRPCSCPMYFSAQASRRGTCRFASRSTLVGRADWWQLWYRASGTVEARALKKIEANLSAEYLDITKAWPATASRPVHPPVGKIRCFRDWACDEAGAARDAAAEFINRARDIVLCSEDGCHGAPAGEFGSGWVSTNYSVRLRVDYVGVQGTGRVGGRLDVRGRRRRRS